MKNLPNLKRAFSFTFAALMIAVSSATNAQTLVTFNPTGPSENAPLAPSSVSPLITSTDLTRGPGTNGYDNAGSANNFFGAYYVLSGDGHEDATLAGAVSNGIYESFTITAGATGADVRGLSLKNDFFFQNSNNYTIEDSGHGFGTAASNILASIPYPGARFGAGPTVTFATPEELLPGQSDTFRIYVDSLGTFTDFGIGDGGTGAFGSTGPNTNAFTVTGGVIPEPSTYAMLALGLASLVVLVRRRSSVA